MKFSHYSNIPLVNGKLLPINLGDDPSEGMKPHGLWLSVDGPDDWKAWCMGEGFRTDYYTQRQEVTLVSNILCGVTDIPKHRVLLISNAAGLRRFAHRYPGRKYDGDRKMSDYWRRNMVDWRAVMQVYKGIVIAPYIWSMRLATDMMWYYSWDCASGCIWDVTAIEHVGEPEPCDFSRPTVDVDE